MKKALIRFSSSILNALVFHNMVKLPYLDMLALFHKPSSDFRVDAADLKDKTLCFLLGSPRSGTTLSSILLDYTDKVACPPELYLATFDDLAQRKDMMGKTVYKSLGLGIAQGLARTNRRSLASSHAMVKDAEKKNLSTAEIYDYFLARSESVFVDKTPCYLSYVSDELFSSRYPKAKYIYVYRHPLAVIQSQKSQMDSLSDEQFRKFGMKASEMHKQGKIGLFAMAFAKREAFAEFQDYKMEAQQKSRFDKFKVLESWWYYENLRTIEFLKTIPDDQKFVYSFESLVKDPVKTLSDLYAFLGIDSDPRIAISTYENEKAPDTVGAILGSFWNWEIGDPHQIFMKGKIEPSRANDWERHSHLWDKLEEKTRQLAVQMGYEGCDAPAGQGRSNPQVERSEARIPCAD